MINYNFWEDWENKTELEERAIEVIEKAKKAVINSLPKDALVAIYIKGSFARREMKEGSDIDIVPIVTEDQYEGAVFGLNTPEVQPACVIPLSISELKNNKLSSKGNFTPDLRAEPDLFLAKLNEYGIIYGNPLNPEEYPVRSENEILHSEINKIKHGYIKAYQEGIIDFQPLLKEVFWLVEWEQKAKGVDAEHSFEGIAQTITNRNHIIYDALDFRKNPNKEKEEKFISKLEIYLNELEQH